jgi:hypothetical protein
MDSIDDDISFYLDNYRNNFIADGLNQTTDNDSLLENAKNKINSLLNNLTIEKNRLLGRNKNMRNTIEQMNFKIEKATKENEKLRNEETKFKDSDLGAIKQNTIMSTIYKNYKFKLFGKLCLLVIILIFLYINDDVVQAIRKRFSKNTK